MGFLRKAAFVSTGGMSGLVIKANSKKERTAKAMEKQVKLQKQAVRAQQRVAHQQSVAARQQAHAVQDTRTLPATPTPVSLVGGSSAQVTPGTEPFIADELRKLADLQQSGVLTEEEFEAQKAKLLNGD